MGIRCCWVGIDLGGAFSFGDEGMNRIFGKSIYRYPGRSWLRYWLFQALFQDERQQCTRRHLFTQISWSLVSQMVDVVLCC